MKGDREEGEGLKGRGGEGNQWEREGSGRESKGM